jgi:hypothetical protein
MDHSIFDFLELPPELRLEIYIYHIHSSQELGDDAHSLNMLFVCKQIHNEYVAQAIKSAAVMCQEIENMETNHHKFTISQSGAFRDLTHSTVTVILRSHDKKHYSASSLGEQITRLINVHPTIRRCLHIDFKLEAVPNLLVPSWLMEKAIRAACHAINAYIKSVAGLSNHGTVAAEEDATYAPVVELFHEKSVYLSWPGNYPQTWLHYQIWYLRVLCRSDMDMEVDWRPGRWEYMGAQNGRETVKVSWDKEDGGVGEPSVTVT